jgi:hypothetical protein
VNTSELSGLLRDATDGVEPSTGFTRKVLDGGRRRRLRRRITVAASAVVVAAVAVAGTVVAVRDDAAPVSVTDQRLTTPTRGDLATDRLFLNEVLGIWQDELPLAAENRYRFYDDPRGDPHIVWAGDTPVGRAAVVVQQIFVHQDYWVRPSRAGMRLAEGLVAVDPADGELKLVGTRSHLSPPEAVPYFLFGPDNRTMLIVDEGKPLYYATEADAVTDTSGDNSAAVISVSPIKPQWHPIRASGGIALVSVSDRPGPGQAHVSFAYQGDHPPERVEIGTKGMGFASTSSEYLATRLGGSEDRLPIPNFFRWKDTWTFGTPVTGVSTNSAQFTVDDRIHSAWQITVWLPGRVVIVKETQIDKEPSQFDRNGSVLTVTSGRIVQNDLADVHLVDVARVDHDAVLPISYHIPDGGGWVVAQKGKPLSYRTAAGGQWQDAGRDAALLPDNAVEVKVDGQVVTL